ncbi:MAG: nicotinate (nicotinamide) nucleotide adenylyltransferase [Deltaproteobacteria bacterium]|nr:nicotinate (nicotinamide) nucleotide adenylyltransferase [Deltaproteobacteria bacterium]
MEISDNNSDCYIKLPLRSILVFGGSFNPVHQGHIELIKNLLKLGGEPEILVIPVAQSPFKSREDLIPAETRWQLLGVALPKNPRLHLSNIEVNRSGLSYSYETWQQLCEQYRPENWFWVIGSDTFAEFDRWYQADEFVKKIQLIIVKRKEKKAGDVSAFWGPLTRLFPVGQNSMDEKEFWHDGERIATCLDFDLPAVSSSEIRKGKSGTQWIVPSTRFILQSALDDLRVD